MRWITHLGFLAGLALTLMFWIGVAAILFPGLGVEGNSDVAQKKTYDYQVGP